MNRAIFLDRDGVLSKEKDRYLHNLEDFEILDHAIPNLKKLTEAGYLLVMVSNQGGISRGGLTIDLVDSMHEKLRLEMTSNSLELAEYYYCPHHPDNELCICRKPEPLLIQKAMARFKIDPSSSFMIGDSPRDVEAAERAGVTGFQIESNADWSRIVHRILAS